jgi:hypothetical protein
MMMGGLTNDRMRREEEPESELKTESVISLYREKNIYNLNLIKIE